MIRSRRLLMSLALFALMVLTANASLAAPSPQGKGNEKGKPAKGRLAWSMKRVERTLTPGQSTTVKVTLTSAVDLQNLKLRVTEELGQIVKVSPDGTFNLSANTPLEVTLTMTLPANAVKSQGGVVQVRMGDRNMAEPLKVKVRVPGDDDDDAKEGEAKDKNKDKGQGQNNGQGRGNGKGRGNAQK